MYCLLFIWIDFVALHIYAHIIYVCNLCCKSLPGCGLSFNSQWCVQRSFRFSILLFSFIASEYVFHTCTKTWVQIPKAWHRIGYLTRTPTRHEKPFLSCWLGLSKRIPKHTAYCCCPWLLAEVEGKSLLLKSPCILDIGFREPHLDLTWKPPPWLSWHQKVPCIFQRKKQSAVLPSYAWEASTAGMEHYH